MPTITLRIRPIGTPKLGAGPRKKHRMKPITRTTTNARMLQLDIKPIIPPMMTSND
jgi:hypothetical protein